MIILRLVLIALLATHTFVAQAQPDNVPVKEPAKEPITAKDFVRRAEGNDGSKEAQEQDLGKRISQMISDYSKAIELEPQFTWAYYYRAIERAKISTNEADWKLVIEDCNKVITLITELRDDERGFDIRFDDERRLRIIKLYMPYWLRAQAHASLKEFKNSIEDQTHSISLNGGLERRNAYNYKRRGDIYLESGDTDKAIADYSTVIDLSPKQIETYVTRANALRIQKKFDAALLDFAKAIELDTRHNQSSIYNRRAKLWEDKGDWDTAIADHTKAIEIHVNNAQSYMDRGFTYLRKGEKDKAAGDLTKAIELNPKLKPVIEAKQKEMQPK